MKRISITRLKLDDEIIEDIERLSTWNQKNLDYEIETILKNRGAEVVQPWNQKNLDYEIETCSWQNAAACE